MHVCVYCGKIVNRKLLAAAEEAEQLSNMSELPFTALPLLHTVPLLSLTSHSPLKLFLCCSRYSSIGQ